MGTYAFGIDVGGTSIKCGLFTDEGKLLDKWEIPTRTEVKGAYVLPDIAKTILEKCEEKSIDKDQVDGVGLAVPGPVLQNGDVAFAVNLHWDYTEAAKVLSELTSMNVKTGNDANVATLGEMWAGGGRGTRNLVMITLGTGVGGGIILNGEIIGGTHGAGGEIGHMCVDTHDPIACNCGGHGCLEQKASATGIVRLAREELAVTDKPTVLNPETVTSKDVFDAYAVRDEVAVDVVHTMSDYLGRAMAILACSVDPEKFLIGGGVSRAGEPLRLALEKAYQKYCFPACRNIPIAIAELGNDAGIYGAAKLVIK